MILQLSETFMELLFQSNLPQWPEIFIPSWWTLMWKQPKVAGSRRQWKVEGWGSSPTVNFFLPLTAWQIALGETKHSHDSGTNCSDKVQATVWEHSKVTLSVLPHNKPGWLSEHAWTRNQILGPLNLKCPYEITMIHSVLTYSSTNLSTTYVPLVFSPTST